MIIILRSLPDVPFWYISTSLIRPLLLPKTIQFSPHLLYRLIRYYPIGRVLLNLPQRSSFFETACSTLPW